MRTVSFVLLDTTLEEVHATLRGAGFEPLPEAANCWNYPPGLEAVLFASCCEYDQRDADEHLEVVRHAGSLVPSVQLFVHVSGRVPGDSEVMAVTETLLSAYHGMAFDDYSQQAWTLPEIRSRTTRNGLHFFDYSGTATTLNEEAT